MNTTIDVTKDEIWVLKRNTTNAWMGVNNIKTHLIRGNGEATKTIFCVPIDGTTGQPKDIFNKNEEERESIANLLKLPVEHLLPGSDFLNERSVILIGDSKEFNLNNANDYLDHLIVKANTSSVNVGDKFRAGAEYIFICEEERIQKEVKKREVKAEAYILLKELNKDEKESILLALGFNTIGMSQAGIEDAIGKKVEETPQAIVDIYKVPNFKGIVFIRKGIHANVLKSLGGQIYYNDTLLGFDLSSAASYVLDKNNALVVEGIKRDLAAKK